MKNKKIILLSLITIFLTLASTALAQEINAGVISGIKSVGFIAAVGALIAFVPFASASSVLGTLLNWLLSIFTFIAVISFIITGIMFIFSGSNPELKTQAKSGLVYSIIGIAIGISGWIILGTIANLMGGSI